MSGESIMSEMDPNQPGPSNVGLPGPSNMGQSGPTYNRSLNIPQNKRLARSNAQLDIDIADLGSNSTLTLNSRSVISLETLVFTETCSNDSILVDIRNACTSDEYININNEILSNKTKE